MSGAIGAFATKDGVPSGGLIFDLKGRAPDVENLELAGPVLYLYRKEYRDSAGAGRWARGNTVGAVFVPHGTDVVFHNPSGVGVGAPTSAGLFGGYPGNTNTLHQKRGTDLEEWFARGDIPSDLNQLGGTLRRLQPRETGVEQKPGDAHLFLQSAGAGYGDPLLREPERVAEDVVLGYVSVEMAHELYGVVIDEAGAVDEAATKARRRAIRAERIGGGEPREIAERDGERVTETLIIDAGRLTCRMCGTDTGDAAAPYKEGLRRRDLPITAGGPLIDAPSNYVDAEFELRQFACPGCGTLVENEVARVGDPVLSDIELA
jgi:N-methylhydantoinase B